MTALDYNPKNKTNFHESILIIDGGRERKEEDRRKNEKKRNNSSLEKFPIKNVERMMTRKSPAEYQRSNCPRLDLSMDAEISRQMFKLK